MSRSVDERVVEMRFNNKQFEQGISESTKSLQNLKKSLKLEDASKGLQQVESAGKRFSLDNVATAVELVSNKFSVLGTFGDQVIRRLADGFMDLAGKALNFTKSLSVDQISAGWDKYTNKTEAVQTIMNATGKDIDYVNERLEKLQWFTDETSYNFVDMTSSIGDFTNAGVELDDAVNAMMGIANWAAVSGGNVQQAGMAMRNLSQAMSMDKVLVQDWQSIEKAGMATMEFKQNVIDTAVELGYLRDMGNGVIETMGGAEVTAEGFRGTLEEGWFSGKVLTETLKKYSEYTNAVYDVADAYDTCSEAMEHVSEEGMELSAKAFKAGQQYKTFKDVIDATKDAVSSGWMTTFELIFGNMEEAKSLWTDVGGMFWDIFASGAEARNEVLSVWRNDMDGWEFVTDSIWSIYRAFESVREAAREGWQQVFPKMTAERLFEITRSINKFFNRIADWAKDAKTMERITTIFKGFGSAIQVTKKILSALFAPLKRLKEALDESGTGVLDLTARFFNLFTKLNESEKFQNILDTISDKIGDVLVWIVGFVKQVKEAFSDLKTYLEPVIEKFKEGFDKLKDVFVNAQGYFEPVAQKIKGAFDKIKESISSFGKTDTTSSETVFDKLRKAATPFIALFEGIKKGFEFVWSVIKKVGPMIGAAIKFIGDVLKNLFSGLQSILRDGDLNGVAEILGSGVIGALILAIKSLFGGLKDFVKNAGGIVDSIKNIFGALQESLQAFTQNLQAKALKELALAIGVLALSVLIISAIDPKKLETAVTAIGALFIELMMSFKSLSGSKSTMRKAAAFKKTMKSLISVAAAVFILALAMKKLADLDSEQIKRGTLAIGALLLELSLYSKIMAKGDVPKKMTSTGLGLILLAVAVRLLVKPMKELGSMDPEDLTKGIIAIGAVLTELALFTKLAGGQKKMISIGLGLIEVAAALKIISSVLAEIGQLSWESIAKGLVGIAGSIVSIAAAMKMMPKGAVLKGAGFVIVAAGLKIIASVIEDISNLSWEGIAKGLVAVGVAVAGIAAAMNMMPTSSILKAAGFVVVAAGLKVIASVINDISLISWNGVAKGLVVMAAAVVGICAAMKMMPKGAVLKGAGFVIVAAGLKIIASVMEDISALSWGDIAKGLVAIGVALVGIVAIMNQMSSSIGGAAALFIVAGALNAMVPVMQGLGALSWSEILKALVALAGVLGVLGLAGKMIDPFANAVMKLGAGLILIAAAAGIFSLALSGIAVAIEILASTGEVAVHAFLGALSTILTALPSLLQTLAISIKNSASALVDMISTIIGALLQAIGENVPKIVETVLDVILQVLTALVEKAPAIIGKVLEFILEIFKGLRAYLPQIADEVIQMFKAIIDSLSDAIGGLSFGNIVSVVAELAGLGLILGEVAAIAAIGVVATAMLPLIGKNLTKFIDAVEPFLEKIQQVDANALHGAEALANTVMTLTKASILDALTGWFRGGGDAMIKFGEQIAQLGPYIKQYADSISGIDSDAVLKSALAAQALAEFAHHIPKEGGLLQKITGETDLLGFVEALVELGPALKNYAASVDGLDAGVVENSINAASVISAFANNLPRHGGFVQAIIGDNSLNQFAQDLTVFGPNMMAYAQSVDGLKADVVIASAQAAEAISAMANGLPNQGGAVAWFAGDNTLSAFGEELAAFGPKFAEYGEAIANITPETVTASADAAAALFAVAQNVPNQGGVVSWFAGDNTLSKFAEGLVPFGEAMQKYSASVAGLGTGDITASAGAAEAMFKVAALVPNQGGVVSWFAGDNKLGDFAAGLIPFGEAMQSYAQSVTGLKVAPIVRSAMAASAIFEVAHSIPNQGGIISWFAGDNKIGDFAEGLKPFGKALKSFGESVTDLPGDDIIAATQVMKELFTIVDMMPNQGGIKSWFVGDNKLSVFAEELEAFAPSLRKYAEELEGVTISNITASGRALKVLFESIAEMPNQGGVVSWFTGDNTLGDIGKDLEVFGPAFASFASSLDDVGADTLLKVSMAFGTLKTLGSVLNSIPDQGGFVSWFVGDNTLGAVGKDLETFGPAYADFAKEVSKIDDLNAISVAFEGIQILANAISSMPDQGGIKSWFGGDQSLAGLAEGLPELGAALASFSTDLGTDFKVLPVMQAFGTLKYLGEALDAMPGEGGLAQWFSGETSLVNIGAGLKEFGPAFADFSKQVVDLKPEPVENAFNTIKVLAESLDSMPPSGGLTQWFTGDNSLVSVGEGMKKFGPSFVSFSLMVQNLKMEPVENAFRSIRVMAEALDSMPNQGGVVSWFTGDKSLAGIGEDLAKFGPKLKEYSDTVAGVKTAKVKASFQATKELAVALDSMPNKGGVASWFKGDKSLGSLGDDLPNYGVALYKFYVEISHINVDKVREGISLTEGFVNVMSGIEGKRAAFIEWFTGDKSLSTLGKDLAAYGEWLGKFQENVADLKFDRIMAVKTTTEAIIGVVNSMEPIGGWDDFWNGKKSLASLGDQLASLGGYFKSYAESTDGINWAKMGMSIDVLYQFLDLGKDLAGVDFGGYWNFAESFNNLALTGTDTFIQTFEGKYGEAETAGTQFLQNILNGFAAKTQVFISTANSFGNYALNGLRQSVVNNEPYTIGANFIQGFINGMKSKQEETEKTTAWVTRKQADIMRQTLGIASPSKVTHQIGEYLMEGLANGMVDGSSVANNASREVSDEVLMAMTNAIASVMALMQSDGTFTPVIRPVVDLSDAEKQAGEIGGLFGKQTVAGSGFAAAAGLNRSIQNGAVLGGSSTTTTNNSAAITINVYGGRGQSAQDIADEVQKRLKQDLDRRGYAFR